MTVSLDYSRFFWHFFCLVWSEIGVCVSLPKQFEFVTLLFYLCNFGMLKTRMVVSYCWSQVSECECRRIVTVRFVQTMLAGLTPAPTLTIVTTRSSAVAPRLPGRFNSDYYFFMLLDETSQSIKSPVEVACLRMTL